MTLFGVGAGARISALRLAALACAGALVLSGCGPIGAGPTNGPRTHLTLKIGAVLPQTGVLKALGPPTAAGVALAVKEINAAHAGITVKAEYRDSGDTTKNEATASVAALLDHKVSAIVGATGSGVSKTVIDTITSAGVVQISPADTTVDFSSYADHGLYWRTSPSDVLQGEVLGDVIAEDGVEKLGIIQLHDSYGDGLTGTISEHFESAGGKVVKVSLFDKGQTDFGTQVKDMIDAQPDAVALVTFAEAKSIVPALLKAGYKGKFYFVDGNLLDYSSQFRQGVLEGDKGTIPGLDTADLGDFTSRLLAVDPTLKDFSYAAESYDAVMLLAFAALAANSTDGKDIAGKLREVSGGTGEGKKTRSFATGARTILDGGIVDYDGYSGPITFDENGDPTQVTIGVFEYDHNNRFARVDSVSP